MRALASKRRPYRRLAREQYCERIRVVAKREGGRVGRCVRESVEGLRQRTKICWLALREIDARGGKSRRGAPRSSRRRKWAAFSANPEGASSASLSVRRRSPPGPSRARSVSCVDRGDAVRSIAASRRLSAMARSRPAAPGAGRGAAQRRDFDRICRAAGKRRIARADGAGVRSAVPGRSHRRRPRARFARAVPHRCPRAPHRRSRRRRSPSAAAPPRRAARASDPGSRARPSRRGALSVSRSARASASASSRGSAASITAKPSSAQSLARRSKSAPRSRQRSLVAAGRNTSERRISRSLGVIAKSLHVAALDTDPRQQTASDRTADVRAKGRLHAPRACPLRAGRRICRRASDRAPAEPPPRSSAARSRQSVRPPRGWCR